MSVAGGVVYNLFAFAYNTREGYTYSKYDIHAMIYFNWTCNENIFFLLFNIILGLSFAAFSCCCYRRCCCYGVCVYVCLYVCLVAVLSQSFSAKLLVIIYDEATENWINIFFFFWKYGCGVYRFSYQLPLRLAAFAWGCDISGLIWYLGVECILLVRLQNAVT